MSAAAIRPVSPHDRLWVAALLKEYWASTEIVSRGRVHRADRLPGFIAEVEDRPVGLLTYHIERDQCEIVSLNSLREGMWIGSSLLEASREAAQAAGCRRMWLITTNDNLAALGFYQKRGWRLVAIHRDALEESRRLKPEIPRVGIDGIPVLDEIELELLL
ncbi:MAG: GNAT family N-acetyltransferase [Planctomycetes bacterium]|nr:GNAT family N-acetyltransferase [Planctomycetota bacterium]